MCEEFACPPSVAVEQPWALTLRIMDLRRYARLHAALHQAEQSEGADTLTGFEEVWRMRTAIYGGGAEPLALPETAPDELARMRTEQELFG